MSLEDVHARLKIHPRVLQLLEEDKFDKLPSPLYVKSFLKSYAEFLEISPEELLDNYEKEKRKDPEQALYIRPAEAGTRRGLHPFYIVVAFFAALALFVFLVGKPVQHAMKSWGAAKKSSAVAKTVKIGKDGVPETSILAPKGEGPGRELWLNSVEQGNFPKINGKTPLSLEIRALDAVWLRVSADGAILYQGILKKGTTEHWSAKDAIEIWTGNASSMTLVLNKTALGSPGKGVVKRMIVSREGIRITSSGAR